jgi:hypothetical protein
MYLILVYCRLTWLWMGLWSTLQRRRPMNLVLHHQEIVGTPVQWGFLQTQCRHLLELTHCRTISDWFPSMLLSDPSAPIIQAGKSSVHIVTITQPTSFSNWRFLQSSDWLTGLLMTAVFFFSFLTSFFTFSNSCLALAYAVVILANSAFLACDFAL